MFTRNLQFTIFTIIAALCLYNTPSVRAQDGFLCGELSIAAKVSTPSSVESVFADSDRLYIADRTDGLHIVDAHDPANPVLLGTLPLSGAARLVAANGLFAYVIDTSGHLQIVDVSEPTTPFVTGQLAIPQSAQSLQAFGTSVYIAAGIDGVLIADVSNPNAPQVLGTIDPANSARDVFVAGAIAYVADWEAGLVIYDISIPDTPVEIGRYDQGGFVSGVQVASEVAYITAGATMTALDVSDPHTPTPLGDYSATNTDTIRDIVAIDTDVYIVGQALRIVSMENAEQPELLGYIGLPESAGSLVAMDQHLVVGNKYNGALIVDPARAPISPLIGSVSAGDNRVIDVHTFGNVAYVLGGPLTLFDISTPETPVLLNTIDTWSFTYAMEVRGDIAYLADGATGISVLDVSDPHSPVLIGTEDQASAAHDLFLQGEYLYVAAGTSGLRVLDISNPVAPHRVNQIDTNSRGVYGVTGHGNTLCFADSLDGAQVFDISDPQSPVYAGTIERSDNVSDVLMIDNLVYVYTGEIFVYDLALPHEPAYLTRLMISGTTDGTMSRHTSLVYVGGARGGLYAVDITTPQSPRFVASYTSEDDLLGTAPHQDVLYVANDREGLLVLSNAACTPCVADWDRNSVVDSRDVISFLNDWVTGDDAADLTGDGLVNTMDFIAFLNAWTTGCN